MRTRLLGGIAALLFVLVVPLRSVHAIGPIVSMTIAPESKAVIAGDTVTFTVQGKDADNNTSDLTVNCTFTTTDPQGQMASNVYTAGQAGTWKVTAKYSSLTSEATVTVTHGAIAELQVNPNSDPERVANGKSRTFTAVGFDAFNNIIDDLKVTWTVEGEIGTIVSTGDRTGKFTASHLGEGKVVAQSSSEKTSVDITVVKPEVIAPATNTNSTITNTNSSNTNSRPVNTNTSNANTNANANANVNASNANTNTTAQASTDSTCSAWPKMTWIWIYIAYLIALIGSLAAVRRMNPGWWWFIPFLLTVVAIWVYFQFRCYPVYPAWPYVVLLTAILGASWYTWQRDGQTPPVQPPAM